MANNNRAEAAAAKAAALPATTVQAKAAALPVSAKASIQAAAALAAEADRAGQQLAANQAEAAAALAEQQRKAVLLSMLAVLDNSEAAAAEQQSSYKTILYLLADKLCEVSEISPFCIDSDSNWPLNEKADKTLGIDKAAKVYRPAAALKAFNVWRSNYAVSFAVVGKSAASLFKKAEAMVAAEETAAEQKGQLKKALNLAGQQAEGYKAAALLAEQADRADRAEAMVAAAALLADLEKALSASVDRAEQAAGRAADDKAAEAEQAAEAMQIADTIRLTDMSQAGLSRILNSIMQLSENTLLLPAEAAALLAAGQLIADRITAEAAAEAAEKTEAAEAEAAEKARLAALAEVQSAFIQAEAEQVGLNNTASSLTVR